jgi:CheY-like chemotaxis protein
MENEDAGFEVIRAARQQAYKPATALLTAYPPENGDWKQEGAQSLLVKPVGTQDLLRQIEALLVLQRDVQHEDEKALRQPIDPLGGDPAGLNREGRRKVS